MANGKPLLIDARRDADLYERLKAIKRGETPTPMPERPTTAETTPKNKRGAEGFGAGELKDMKRRGMEGFGGRGFRG